MAWPVRSRNQRSTRLSLLDEVEVKTRMLDQPHLHVFMFVCAVLIQDRVDLQLLGKLPVDGS
jgi:hypothetical protein